MIYVGIDVAKDKHDCFIINSDGEMLSDVFTITNCMSGFNTLLEILQSLSRDFTKIKVGLEATGHYSYNLLGFLLDNGLTTYVINPLHTNLYRKSLTLRKTKTDKVDARTITSLLMSSVNLKPYTKALYHNEELKSLTRYRFDKVFQRGKLKQSVSRLITILFPELEKIVSTVHTKTVYSLLMEFPSAKHIADAHLTRLSNLLEISSRGRFKRDKAMLIRDTARKSIAVCLSAKTLELKHTIKLILELDQEISEIEHEIKKILQYINPPLLSIPGIGFTTAAMILAEIGDFSNFDSPDKILAFAGLSPSTYQSGNFISNHAHMEKRGSKYLRFAIFNATRYVCFWNENFSDYLNKKLNEGKHYYVAISHTAKKLIRLIFALQKSGQLYRSVV